MQWLQYRGDRNAHLQRVCSVYYSQVTLELFEYCTNCRNQNIFKGRS